MGTCCEADTDLKPTSGPAGGLARPEGTKLKLEYFGIGYGRADVIVQLLEHKGVDYEYVVATQEEWAARKAAGKGGMGGLPIVHSHGV